MAKKIKSRKDNIVRVGKAAIEKYVYSILERMHPFIYNEHSCIKIQVTDANLDWADVILKKFIWAGLKETSRKKKPISAIDSNGESYILEDAWEIILEKISILDKIGQEWEDGR